MPIWMYNIRQLKTGEGECRDPVGSKIPVDLTDGG